ncbi:hypothetical protein J31TS4_15440 [Paenibacillus sp. J31TS4]|uniref:YheC/YheD family endospore coat-associated protein n=1 Tax=Paenibacillus sp. J31TS4 TaxID=2807195 RepID=UPI001B1F0607|nr:YheC/YheD family protein [Paenibacillus sp. J31TS4]GIP38264.1 hypothetical protein J31TS4_15440 [Paenibacillus sp. J31TS4]
MTAAARPLVGILVLGAAGSPPFADRTFYARLTTWGARLGLTVCVLPAPLAAAAAGGRVQGYSLRPDTGEWEEGSFPLPDLVYDRTFPSGPGERRLRRQALLALGRSGRPAALLGRPLPGKWEVYRALAAEPELARYRTPTVRYRSGRQLLRLLAHRGGAFLKPASGTHGLGALAIRREADGKYAADGRSLEGDPLALRGLTADALVRFAAGWTGARTYLLQPRLDLKSRCGDAYDVRSLVQKDDTGGWTVTGLAVRRAPAGSVTSNLHGGGSAEEAEPFLAAEFGVSRAEELTAAIRRLSLSLAPALERSFGRLAELGLDFGIERSGRIWLLEANSKPGRAAFRRIGGGTARARAVRSPMAYASYLLRSRLGRAAQGTGFRDNSRRVLP